MGLFDKLGAGGGSVSVTIDSAVVAAGTALRGTITFTGGKRAQNITALLVWLTQGKGQRINLVKGGMDETEGGTNPLGEKLAVTGPMKAEPNGVYSFPFVLPVPERVMNSRSFDVNGQAGPVMQHYRVWGSADIPGEIDKHGQSPDFEITNGLKLEVTLK